MAAGGNRKIIGILYNTNPKWMGGVIYILNAIKILNWLEEDRKPQIKLFYRKDLKRFVDEIDYPYLEAIEWEFPEIRKGYMISWLTRKNAFIEKMVKTNHLDAIFPMHDFPISSSRYRSVRQVGWYADLQHKHYPQFFTQRKLWERDLRIRFILKNCRHLVVSSQAVLDDFHRFFKMKDIQTHIFHFASVVDSFDFSGWDALRKEKGLPKEYFMVSNQFHKHKNHQVVLEALGILKERGTRPVVAFTGRMPSIDQSEYIRNLHGLIEKHNLEQQVVFLGVLSRQQQLTLMRYAQAVIQPSLFEGWSTVIEDAISLQTPVIASKLNVNQEQLGGQATFFPKKNASKLAHILSKYPSRKNFNKKIYEDYDDHVKKAAESFLQIMI